MSSNTDLSVEERNRLDCLTQLIEQVQTIVRESGEPEGFNPARWFEEWTEQPAPALGGRKPAEFLDTAEGRETVSALLSQMQSGAYA